MIITTAHSGETRKDSFHKEYTTNASWYKEGKKTANGERFNPYGLTVAHRSLPFGTLLRLTNNETGRSIIVRVNDRGPFIKNRTLDVTLGCARMLGMNIVGVTKLQVQIL